MQNREEIDQIAIFTNKDGDVRVNVKLETEMVWLTQNQIAELFEKDRSVITKHIRNILKEEELDASVCAKFAHTSSDGKVYKTNYYNLDMIISVGYRVNSKRGIEFRRWANTVLKDYLIKGYSINEQKLDTKKISELQNILSEPPSLLSLDTNQFHQRFGKYYLIYLAKNYLFHYQTT